MISKLNEEVLNELARKANKYSNEMSILQTVAFHPKSPSLYAKGVIDGVENTSYVAFMAGAKAMWKMLSKNE